MTTLHPDAVRNFDEKAEAVLTLIKGITRTEMPSFRPDRFVAGTITVPETAEISRQVSLTDAFGSETGRFFVHSGQRYGLLDDDHKAFLAVVSGMQRTKALIMAQKLFIGGLAFSTSTETLRDTFGQAGHVESAAVVTDRITGQSRGFGFVDMSTAQEADQAIAMLNGKDLDGRQIRVEKATSSGAFGGARDGSGGSSRRGRW